MEIRANRKIWNHYWTEKETFQLNVITLQKDLSAFKRSYRIEILVLHYTGLKSLENIIYLYYYVLQAYFLKIFCFLFVLFFLLLFFVFYP